MTSDTSLRPVSPLRARMIEDMTARGFKDDTRRDYVRHVRAFAAFISAALSPHQPAQNHPPPTPLPDQFPIDRQLSPLSRGFVLRGLSDAGPLTPDRSLTPGRHPKP
jgi:hypothetical protein